MRANDTPERIAVIWSPEVRTDLRAFDRETAMQILYCLDRYLSSSIGNVKKLKPPLADFRLRCGDYRLFSGTVRIAEVRSAIHGSKSYDFGPA